MNKALFATLITIAISALLWAITPPADVIIDIPESVCQDIETVVVNITIKSNIEDTIALALDQETPLIHIKITDCDNQILLEKDIGLEIFESMLGHIVEIKSAVLKVIPFGSQNIKFIWVTKHTLSKTGKYTIEAFMPSLKAYAKKFFFAKKCPK